jgi:RecA-family ATPase
MSGLPDWVKDAGKGLGELDADERQKMLKAINQIALAQAPDETVAAPPIRTLGDYLDWEIELPPILVEPGIVARGAITATTSRGGKGKTALSLNRIVRWALGRPLFDNPAVSDVMRPTGELKTLVIENEGAPGMFQDVIRKIVNNGGFTEDEVAKIRSNVLIWGDGGWSGLKLDNPADLSMIERGLAEYKPDILFMEPFKGLWKGDENSSTEMANVLDALNGLGTRFNCGVMLTHHERKSGVGEDGDEMSASRGSSVLEAAAAVMERWRPVQNGSQRELKWTKWRFAQPAAPIRMQFDPHRHGYDWVSEDVLLRQILAVMEQAPADWYTVGEIAEEIGESERNVRNVLKEHAKDDGRFKAGRNPDGGFRYRLTQSNGDEDSPGGLSIT